MWLDVGGAAILGVAPATEPALARSIARAFAPYLPHSEGSPEADVAIEPITDAPTFLDIEGAAGDGLVTAYDGKSAFLVRGRSACAVPDPIHQSPAVFAYTAGFPVRDLLRSYIRPAVALAALRRDAVVVHASAVALNGRAVLVGGWSESGKTEVALALAEAGAEFLSDKWTIVRADGNVSPFPASVGIRRWVLPYLPRLRAGLPRVSRVQFLGAGAVSLAARPFQRPSRNAILREAGVRSAQVSSLADRAALSLDQLRAIYGASGDATTPVPLGGVVLLSTVAPGTVPVVAQADGGTVALRLARAAAFERRAYFAVTERVRYGGATDRMTDGPTVTTIESGLLLTRFAGADLLEVRTPFPGDPRRVADRILRELQDR